VSGKEMDKLINAALSYGYHTAKDEADGIRSMGYGTRFMKENEVIIRNAKIELLEAYSKFLEEEGYTDTDWRAEEPFAIDKFLKK
jgi:hypothetical protein